MALDLKDFMGSGVDAHDDWLSSTPCKKNSIKIIISFYIRWANLSQFIAIESQILKSKFFRHRIFTRKLTNSHRTNFLLCNSVQINNRRHLKCSLNKCLFYHFLCIVKCSTFENLLWAVYKHLKCSIVFGFFFHMCQ